MTADPFKELREQPYPLYIAPEAYSFDLNADLITMIQEEFNAAAVCGKLKEAIGDKSGNDAVKAAEELFTGLGKQWMSKTIQLGEEYSDRTIEVVFETVDRNGEQFMIFPHVHQRFIEIAYLGTQDFMKLPMILNNMTDLAYRVPQCALFNKIKEDIGEECANQMTCKSYCLSALDTVKNHIDIDLLVNQTASTATDGYCQFAMKKI
ncbi:MAG: hypothetical protein V3S89_05790 [Desulfobacterales bacterium]